MIDDLEYVAFEIGRGGPTQQKVPARDLCDRWNGTLARGANGLRIRPGHGSTGNYLVRSESSLPVSDVFRELTEQLERKFVVFAANEFILWLQNLRVSLSAAPRVPSGRRPTPGAIMNMDTNAGVPQHLPVPDLEKDPVVDSNAWVSSNFAVNRVRGVWKNDLLRPDGTTLDPDRREGTWGALAKAMKRAHRGDWTARPLSTLDGASAKIGTAWPSATETSLTTVGAVPTPTQLHDPLSLLLEEARSTRLEKRSSLCENLPFE